MLVLGVWIGLIDMSPLWGYGLFVCPVFYKHVAPLGLKPSPPRSLVFPFSQRSQRSVPS